MSDHEESVWVVFNGEIYNFQAEEASWRITATASGRSRTPKVIVHGYKQWGDDVLDRLNGMFGLAIWDVRKRRLVLARGPLRIKLLYYRIDGGRLEFGSEIRAVHAATPARREIDANLSESLPALPLYALAYTLFKDVRKLAPGTKLTVENGACQVSRWYRFKPRPSPRPSAPTRPPKSS